MRLIDAEKIYISWSDAYNSAQITRMVERKEIEGKRFVTVPAIVRAIRNTPTEDPVRRGVWETEGKCCTCSVCQSPAPVRKVLTAIGTHVWRPYYSNYCPRCGSKMLGGEME